MPSFDKELDREILLTSLPFVIFSSLLPVKLRQPYLHRLEKWPSIEPRRSRRLDWAEARAIEAKGLAEAAAILKKAEAWKQFNEAAKLQAVLEKLPSVIESAAPVFSAIATPLGSID